MRGSGRLALRPVSFVLAFGLLLYACQTEKLILVSNSEHFDYKDPSTIGNRDNIPPWVNTANYKAPAADGNFYAVGVSDKPPFNGRLRLSEQEASAEAVSDAQRKIAEHIRTEIKSLLDSSTRDTVAVTQEKGRTKVKQESRDELIMNVAASSSAVLNGLVSEAVFWEKYEKVGKDGAVREYYTYYVRVRIPETEIAKERERLAKIQDFEAEQLENFDMLRKEYVSVKENLSRIDYQGNEAFYNAQFQKLLAISAMLQNMKFADANSQPHREQAELLKTAENDIAGFDPQDRQKQLVRTLQGTVVTLRSEIDRLKNDHGGTVREKEFEIQLRDQKIASLQGQLDNALQDLKTEINNLHSRGVTFVSQYTLFAYPPRPNERLVALDGNSVYIASAPVSNREFSAFLTAANGNNVSIDPSALESPAVSVSWIQAAAYCNWLSRLYGYGEYYAVSGETVSVNGRGDGYRLPARNEILAGLKDRVIEPDGLTGMGILGSGSDRGSMYAYRLPEGLSEAEDMEALLSERIMSGSEYDVETGFRVARDAQR
ncbi:MAG: SUMF1/EgtB/PvdO family nonheme iron enzyme [Spirochaetaceae bacterium]|nr:SUMF1/EgtB/PvdO family nonheme iron enzyme [Spirochaetaceae bacterium]